MAGLFGRIAGLFRRKPGVPDISAEPDAPLPFGYKTSWLAVRSADTLAVAEGLGVTRMQAANWETGVRHGYGDGGGVFVTPPVRGWTLVVTGLDLALDGEAGIARVRGLLERLSDRFGACQYFGSYRVVDYHAWARAETGRMTRAFAVADGMLCINEGRAGQEEQALFGFDPTGMDEAGYFDAMAVADAWLDEDAPMEIAGHWSVNPLVLEGEAGAGFSGFMA